MQFSKFASEVKAGKFASVYLFTGAELFLHNYARIELRKAVLSPGSEDFDLEILDGSEIAIERISSAVRSLPMISERKLVLVNKFDEIDSRQYEKLFDFLKKDSINKLVLALFYEKKPDFSKKSILTQMRDEFSWVNLSPRGSAEFVKIIELMVPNRKINANLASFLADSGVDLWQIKNWLEQAQSYTDDGQELTIDSMREFIDLGGTADIWRLEEAVGSRKIKKAQFLLQDLLRNKEKPGTILWRLKDLFAYLDVICKIRARRQVPKKFSSELNLHPYRLDKYIAYSKNFSKEMTAHALLKIQETDLRLKTSSGDPKSIFIELLDGIIGEKK